MIKVLVFMIKGVRRSVRSLLSWDDGHGRERKRFPVKKTAVERRVADGDLHLPAGMTKDMHGAQSLVEWSAEARGQTVSGAGAGA